MILNKQIMSNFQQTADTLKSLLDDKDKIMDEAKSQLSEAELKEFNAMEKLMNKQLKENDFNGAFRTITKFKQSKKPNKKDE